MRLTTSTTWLAALCFAVQSAMGAAGMTGQIVVGPQAPAMEQYAARELQRYLYQISGTLLEIAEASEKQPVDRPTFVVGQPATNPLVAQLVAQGHLTVSSSDPGPQGYVLRKLTANQQPVLAIAGSDAVGCLYGVYGLLEEHYGAGFYLGGDVLPDTKVPLDLVDVNERKAPAVAIRGFLPWTNFPQSATVYSWEDWRFILDQMAKMRLNFLHIHNYNGEAGHNEMFHSFRVNDILSRVWMATARRGHGWACPGWQITQYRFGGGDLFDDYDFGADCALHNETLSNEHVFRKGVSLFQKVIQYAHTRGVKIGLGLDINLIPPDYQAKADDPRVVAARVEQIVADYPELDYVLCFQSEGIGRNPAAYAVWRKIFSGFYEGIHARSPKTRLAVAGWGLDPASVAELPADVICAPISPYSDGCENGRVYGQREYWGCPWLERDFNSSEYYYPYNMHLSNTIEAWRTRSPNTKGFYCLTWRLTDAIDPKMSFISKAPWDTTHKYTSSQAVYHDYAARNYGRAAADAITPIINQNEPFAVNVGECEGTRPFGQSGGSGFLLNVKTWSVRSRQAPSAPPIEATSYAGQHGVQNAPCTEGAQCIGFIEAGDWVRYDQVDFGEGAEVFEARVASATQGGLIELRLDSPTGAVLGTCKVENTGDWQKWVTQKIDITRTSGKHALYMLFRDFHLSEKEFAKAVEQLAVIDRCIAEASSPAQRARLQWLRCRIAATKDHIELNEKFNGYQWPDLPGAMPSWVGNFTHRVTDISSLGNVMSIENRYVQVNYVARENALRKELAIQPPADVTARGTRSGAVIQWRNAQPDVKGFQVYRNATRLNTALLPSDAVSFADQAAGEFRYTVTAVSADGRESAPSVPVFCQAGAADKTTPYIAVVSPPTSLGAGLPAWIKARVLDGRCYESISATLFYRTPGTSPWKSIPMTRRVKAVFTAEIAASQITPAGLEYYVEASDGDNTTRFPASGPAAPLSLILCTTPAAGLPEPPSDVALKGETLCWKAPPGHVYWYRIYRSRQPDFRPGPDTLLTYVDQGTTAFRDNGFDFEGRELAGTWYYRVTACDRHDRESVPSKAVELAVTPK